MTILSVDLASRRYRDNGIAVLHGEWGDARCEIIAPESLGLRDTPDPERYADALLSLAATAGARLILLDGPQGWRAERSELVHQRQCERASHAPGKTGLPGIVKPASWTRMALFSVALFDALHARGWPRFTSAWGGAPAAIESFPTQAWRSLGLAAMPGRANTESTAPWLRQLAALGVRALPSSPSHDEVQAVVAGLAGIQLLQFGSSGVDARGSDPLLEHGHWREGWIVCPISGVRES
ncbi:DUF429 domain-containing protein [Pseudogemmatithrix spongiicola]|uniref:DUF429 domain-containing protein n=1 Tax=Pseudogemmatithrix spongiicola TaxID=3062599 RepID=A0AA49Q8I9_9BACT|nr:DUF429 domain-containing protein [Gemmatimonadaceae bacterium 'strain 138']WKW15836.1 DUF429 domain-containing protein [Gemmatimonadaceae bacterium 'strain 318']